MAAKRQRSNDVICVRVVMGSLNPSTMAIDGKTEVKAKFLRTKEPTMFDLYALFGGNVFCLEPCGEMLDIAVPLNDGATYYIHAWPIRSRETRRAFEIKYNLEHLRRLTEKTKKRKLQVAALEARCRDIDELLCALDPSRPKEPDF